MDDADISTTHFLNVYIKKTSAFGTLEARVSDLSNRMTALEGQMKKHNFEAILIKMEERLSALERNKLDQVKEVMESTSGFATDKAIKKVDKGFCPND